MADKTVNVVAIKDNWILHDIAQHLEESLPYIKWTEKPSGNCRVTYFVNYDQATPNRVSEIECALFTHLELGVKQLFSKWWQVAETTDVAVCMSKIYADKFKRSHAPTVVIPPGVDLDKFQQKPVKIGVIGSVKRTGRKGEELIRSVMNIPGIEWFFTGGSDWPGGKGKFLESKDIPAFYSNLDYVLIASRYEGGPMSAIEALATGVPIISTEVGWVPELPHISFKTGDSAGLQKILRGLVKQRSDLREAVKHRTWKNFAHKHDVLFSNLLRTPSGNLTKRQVKNIIALVNKTAVV